MTEATYHVHVEVFEQLLGEARKRSAVHMAVLTGDAGEHAGGRFAEVTGVAEQTYTARLETTYRPMRSAVDRVRARFGETGRESEGRIAGVAVVFEDSGGELVEEVARLHLSLFNGPAQVALVGDPETREFGLYGRTPEGTFENMTFEIGERDGR